MRLFLALVLLALPMQAVAHKVIATVYAAGDMIEGEIGLSNGDMAKNLPVDVIGPKGEPLGQVTTDDEGFFTFTPTLAIDHHFRADMGAGHVAQLQAWPVSGVAPIAAINPQEIAEIVRAEMRPIRREIAALKETRDMQSILGGIGYIVGLFGVGFYLTARRRLKAMETDGDHG